MVHMLHVPQDVTHIHLDVAGVGLIKIPVGDDGVQGAVEGQADQFSLGVQGSGAGVAAGDVQGGQVVDGDGLEFRIDVLAEVLVLDRGQLGDRGVEFAFARGLRLHAFDGGKCRPGTGAVGAVVAAHDLAEGHAQGAVGVGVDGLALAVHVGDFCLHVVGVGLLDLPASSSSSASFFRLPSYMATAAWMKGSLLAWKSAGFLVSHAARVLASFRVVLLYMASSRLDNWASVMPSLMPMAASKLALRWAAGWAAYLTRLFMTSALSTLGS